MVKTEDAGDDALNTKAKKISTRATADQLVQLNDFFEENYYPTSADIAEFSIQVELPSQWIASWMTRTRVAKGVAPKRASRKGLSAAKSEPVEIDLSLDPTLAGTSISAPLPRKRRSKNTAKSVSVANPNGSAKSAASHPRITIKLPPLSSIRRTGLSVTIRKPNSSLANSPPTPPSTPPAVESQPVPPFGHEDIPELPDPSPDDMGQPEPPSDSITVPDSSTCSSPPPASSMQTASDPEEKGKGGAWELYQKYRQAGVFKLTKSDEFSCVKTEEDEVVPLLRAASGSDNASVPPKKRKRTTTIRKRDGKSAAQPSRKKRATKDSTPITPHIEHALSVQVSRQTSHHTIELSASASTPNTPILLTTSDNPTAPPSHFASVAQLPVTGMVKPPQWTSHLHPHLPTPAQTPEDPHPTRIQKGSSTNHASSIAASSSNLLSRRFQGLHPFMHDPKVPSRSADEVGALFTKFGLLAKVPPRPALRPPLGQSLSTSYAFVDDPDHASAYASRRRCLVVPDDDNKGKQNSEDDGDGSAKGEDVMGTLKPAQWD